MNFTEPLINQYENFLVFIGLGFLLGVLYELALFIRGLISDKKSAWIVQDIIFSVTATVVIYLMLLAYTNGEIRLILISSTVLGFALFKLTFGKILKALLEKIQGVIKSLINVLFVPFGKISRQIEKQTDKIKATFNKRKAERKKHIDGDISTEENTGKTKFKKIHIKLKKDLKSKQKSV